MASNNANNICGCSMRVSPNIRTTNPSNNGKTKCQKQTYISHQPTRSTISDNANNRDSCSMLVSPNTRTTNPSNSGRPTHQKQTNISHQPTRITTTDNANNGHGCSTPICIGETKNRRTINLLTMADEHTKCPTVFQF